MKNLNLIVKADVQGSVEAVKSSGEAQQRGGPRPVIHGGVGAINETDVMLASTLRPSSWALTSVPTPPPGQRRPGQRGYADVPRDLRCHQRDRGRHEGYAGPQVRGGLLGHAEVRQTYKVSGVGTVAGCYVQDGKLQRKDCQVRWSGTASSSTRACWPPCSGSRTQVKEVAAGYECGMTIEKFNDIKEGDIEGRPGRMPTDYHAGGHHQRPAVRAGGYQRAELRG